MVLQVRPKTPSRRRWISAPPRSPSSSTAAASSSPGLTTMSRGGLVIVGADPVSAEEFKKVFSDSSLVEVGRTGTTTASR